MVLINVNPKLILLYNADKVTIIKIEIKIK